MSVLCLRADSYDVVGANYPKETQGSSYQEIEGEKEVEEDGAYSVVAFQKQVFLNSEKVVLCHNGYKLCDC